MRLNTNTIIAAALIQETSRQQYRAAQAEAALAEAEESYSANIRTPISSNTGLYSASYSSANTSPLSAKEQFVITCIVHTWDIFRSCWG